MAKKTIMTLGDLQKETDDLRRERDEVRQSLEKCKETEAEMLVAIGQEHVKGFKKALRQMAHLAKVSPEGLTFDIEHDMYQGRMVLIDDIPDGTFTTEGDPAVEAEGTSVEEGAPKVAV